MSFIARQRARMLYKSIRHKGSLRSMQGLDDVRFCIEGYPRSANTFVVHMLFPLLQQHFGNERSVIHHTHDIRAVKLAALQEVPVVVLLRNPVDAVVSRCIYHEDVQFCARYLAEWAAYYREVDKLRQQPNLMLCSFDSAVNNLQGVVAAIAERFAIHLPMIENLDQKTEQMLERHLEHSRERRGDGFYKIVPLPMQERSALKERLGQHLQGLDVSEATRLYEALRIVAV